MRIAFVAPLEAGSSFAHAINSVKMAEGFARLGHDVTLYCRRPRDGAVDVGEMASRYGLSQPIAWQAYSGRWKEHRGFTWRVLADLLRRRPDFVYARHYGVPVWAARLGIPTAVETHAHPDNTSRHFRRMLAASAHPRFRALVTISHYLADHYRSQGASAEKILVVPDAVDITLFSPPASLPDSPYESLGPHVTYAGHLYDDNGIPTVLGAAERLPQVQFHLVGGWPEDVARHRAAAERRGLANVRFYGLIPHAHVPSYLWHADLLLLPLSARHPCARWASPVKLGEYLASGTPAIVTSVPGLRDWLTDDLVRFTEPDDPQALASAIRQELENPQRATLRAARARQHAAGLSYTHRAARVLAASGLAAPAPHDLEAPGRQAA